MELDLLLVVVAILGGLAGAVDDSASQLKAWIHLGIVFAAALVLGDLFSGVIATAMDLHPQVARAIATMLVLGPLYVAPRFASAAMWVVRVIRRECFDESLTAPRRAVGAVNGALRTVATAFVVFASVAEVQSQLSPAASAVGVELETSSALALVHQLRPDEHVLSRWRGLKESAVTVAADIGVTSTTSPGTLNPIDAAVRNKEQFQLGAEERKRLSEEILDGRY